MSDAPACHRRQATGDEAAGPVRCAILTVSDSRTPETDASGRRIRELLEGAGHRVVTQRLLPDEPAAIRETLEAWCADSEVQVVVSTGGTGIARRDFTTDVVRALLTTELEGFGELFRMISHRSIGAAAMLSRAVGGLVARDGLDTFLFALPGSVNAAETAMETLIVPELPHLVWLRKGG